MSVIIDNFDMDTNCRTLLKCIIGIAVFLHGAYYSTQIVKIKKNIIVFIKISEPEISRL